MALLFGELADSVDEIKGLAKIGESVGARDVMGVYDAPVRDLFGELFEFFAGKGWDAPAAGHALLAGQVGHGITFNLQTIVQELRRAGESGRETQPRENFGRPRAMKIFCYSFGAETFSAGS